ncbi:WTAP/Mum2 family [Trinorchestia longiramus]|nr:WTAP/Mum2 family [Trinorchestia longiramus]
MDKSSSAPNPTLNTRESSSKNGIPVNSDNIDGTSARIGESELCRTTGTVLMSRVSNPSDNLSNLNSVQDSNVSKESTTGDEKHKTNSDDSHIKVLSKDLMDRLGEEKPGELTSISKEAFMALSPEQMWGQWQQLYAKAQKLHSWFLKNTSSSQADEGDLRDMNERLKNQLAEVQRKEAYHVMRLTAKEHELQEMAGSVASSKCYHIARGSLLDPAVNLCIERLKRDLEAARIKMEEAQNELAAWKFTPDSNTGKQLMAKCRLLIKENEELGRVISSGKLAKLEGDITMQRDFSEELKKSQSELDEFLLEMDEETEGMQGTIMYLQQQLRSTKQQLQQLQAAHSSNSNNISNNGTCSSPSGATHAATPPLQQPAAAVTPPRQPSVGEDGMLYPAAPTSVTENTCSEVSHHLKPKTDTDTQDLPGSLSSADRLSAGEVVSTVKSRVASESHCALPSEAVPQGLKKERRDSCEMLSAVESMIILHNDVSVSVEECVSNGRKRTRDGVDGAAVAQPQGDSKEPVNEPLCKRTKVTMLGDGSGDEAKPNGIAE